MSRTPVARVENLNLVFNADVHRPWTWREAFVRALKSPLSLMPDPANRLHVVKDVSFDVFRGDRIALLGVNGAGKTSLCRCLAGLYHPASGRVSVDGNMRALFDVAVGIRPELTGRENAYLLAELLFPGDERIDELVREALEFSELGRYLDVPLKFYSKGMQARLGLSLSAFRPTDLLILDEVFDGADIFFREKITVKMLELVHKSGAVIFVSHAPDQIRTVCNRLILLDKGTIAFDGAVEEGLNFFERLRPKTRPREVEANA
jgi:ABC-type polysaccharide/polyol phosphate transport system ATPase subunit